MNDLVVTSPGTDHGLVANHGSITELNNGVAVLDGAIDGASALAQGDFIEASVQGVSAALDVVGMIVNPIAGVSSMVANFMMEHCGALQEWLDEMLGDPAVITAGAQSWTNIGNHLQGLSPDYTALVAHDLGEFSGLAINAYRGVSSVSAEVVTALGRISHGVSAGVEVAGGLLAGVRDFVQALVSDLVGAAVDALAKVALTAGIAAPWAGTGLVMKAREVIERCRTFMKGLSTSLDNFAELVGEISPAMKSATKAVSTYLVEGATAGVDAGLTVAFSMGKGVTQGDHDI